MTDNKFTKEELAYKERIAQLKLLPENRLCCDCGARDPTWASFNLGCFMCIDCSGIHRAIGTHITKIRSCTLDKWDLAGVKALEAGGNVRINAIFEAKLKDHSRKVRPQSSLNERDVYIRAKYDRREFYGKPTRESLARSCQEMGWTIDALPPGYLPGVETNGSYGSTTSVSSTSYESSHSNENRESNPALARRRQKQDAEEAAARAAEEAARQVELENQRRAAAAAEAARLAEIERAQATMNELFSPPKPTPAPVASDFSSTSLNSVGFGNFGTTTSSVSLFDGMSTVSPVSVAPPTAVSASGFSFVSEVSTPAAPADAPSVSGFSFVSTPPANEPQQSSGFLFSGLSVSSSSVPQDQKTTVSDAVITPSTAPVPSPSSSSAVSSASVEVPNVTITIGTHPVPSAFGPLFKLPEPTTVEAAMQRLTQLTAINAKASTSLLTDYEARQKALGQAFADALSRAQQTLIRLSTTSATNGLRNMSINSATGSGPMLDSGKSKLDEVLTSMDFSVASSTFSLGIDQPQLSIGGGIANNVVNSPPAVVSPSVSVDPYPSAASQSQGLPVPPSSMSVNGFPNFPSLPLSNAPLPVLNSPEPQTMEPRPSVSGFSFDASSVSTPAFVSPTSYDAPPAPVSSSFSSMFNNAVPTSTSVSSFGLAGSIAAPTTPFQPLTPTSSAIAVPAPSFAPAPTPAFAPAPAPTPAFAVVPPSAPTPTHGFSFGSTVDSDNIAPPPFRDADVASDTYSSTADEPISYPLPSAHIESTINANSAAVAGLFG